MGHHVGKPQRPSHCDRTAGGKEVSTLLTTPTGEVSDEMCLWRLRCCQPALRRVHSNAGLALLSQYGFKHERLERFDAPPVPQSPPLARAGGVVHPPAAESFEVELPDEPRPSSRTRKRPVGSVGSLDQPAASHQNGQRCALIAALSRSDFSAWACWQSQGYFAFHSRDPPRGR